MRATLTSAALTLAITLAAAGAATGVASAQDNSRLPDIGSSAGTVLGPAEQREYGQLTLAQLRHYDLVLDDPLVDGWLRTLGNRLGAASDNAKQEFTFFMLKDRQINAFATLGGYVAVNAGLVLAADREDEVAAVLGHEIAHVTQSHVLRSVERAQRDTIPMLLATLGALAIASQGGDSSANGAMAAIASAQGLAAQRQINYTRANESEADRLGIRTLDRSGYDPDAMAQMFQTMQSLSRVNQGGEKYRTPDYLQSHPVTTLRIAEAKERAERLDRGRVRATTTTIAPDGTKTENVEYVDPAPALRNDAPWSSQNPLLPASLKLVTASAAIDPVQYGWVRERLRVLSATTPQAAIQEYERMRAAKPLDAAQRYGLAYARLRDGRGAEAAAEFAPLLADRPGDLFLGIAMAEAEARAGRIAAADARFKGLLDRMPNNRAVALSYATVLAQRGSPEAGVQAQAMLRPLLGAASEDPIFQTTFARASELAGDPIRAGEAYAEAAWLNGRPEQALVQLNTLKKREGLDYYARSRIDSRIAAITPQVLELRRQGIRDEDLRRR